MTSTLGAVTTSATVANRAIDNTLVRGIDVQTINKTGGTLGRVEAGDRIVLTYSEIMKPSTLIAGWTGTGAATVYVRLTDVAGVESIGLTANSAGTSTTRPRQHRSERELLLRQTDRRRSPRRRC